MIEKLDELRNVFALVTSDSLQCDLETTAVKKPGVREGGGIVRMIGREMITSTSVVGKKKITPRSSKEGKII